MTDVAWRAEDAAVLAWLEDEAAIDALWRAQAPDGAAPPPRSARALAEAARKLTDGPTAVAAAARGDARPLIARVLVERYVGLPGAFVHASAVYFDRLARAWSALGESGDEHATAVRVRSTAAWLALAEERSYLAAIGRRLSHTAKPSEAEAMAHGAALQFFDELRAAAQSGARTLTPSSGRALAALGRIQAAANLAGLDAVSARKYVARADSARAAAVDDALGPIADELAELKTRENGGEHARPAFERVASVWAWSGHDVAVEHFAVDQITELAWPIYKQTGWDKLRALLEPCTRIFESLEARIVRDPVANLAYAADCAQMFVFLSEVENDKTREWAFAERALRLCPTHRNGRLVMAHLCCRRAQSLLDQSNFFTARTDIAEATRLVTRAEEIYPQSGSLANARERLSQARARWGGA